MLLYKEIRMYPTEERQIRILSFPRATLVFPPVINKFSTGSKGMWKTMNPNLWETHNFAV